MSRETQKSLSPNIVTRLGLAYLALSSIENGCEMLSNPRTTLLLGVWPSMSSKGRLSRVLPWLRLVPRAHLDSLWVILRLNLKMIQGWSHRRETGIITK